jgi:hypothetical protein
MHSAANSLAENRQTQFFLDTAMDSKSSLSKSAVCLALLHRNIFEYVPSVDFVIAVTLRGFLEIYV